MDGLLNCSSCCGALPCFLPPSPPLRHEDAPLTFGKIVCRAKNDDYAGRRGEGEGNYMGHFMLDLRPLYCHELSIFALH